MTRSLIMTRWHDLWSWWFSRTLLASVTHSVHTILAPHSIDIGWHPTWMRELFGSKIPNDTHSKRMNAPIQISNAPKTCIHIEWVSFVDPDTPETRHQNNKTTRPHLIYPHLYLLFYYFFYSNVTIHQNNNPDPQLIYPENPLNSN